MLTPNPTQSTYTRYLTTAQVGMPATTGGWRVDTGLCESASIGFGLAVSQGSADRGATLGGAAFKGITRADITLPNVDTTFTDKYVTGDNMGIHVEGDIWVSPENAAVVNAKVYFDATTGRLGGTSGGKTLIPGAKWMTSSPGTPAHQLYSPTDPEASLAVVRLGTPIGNLS